MMEIPRFTIDGLPAHTGVEGETNPEGDAVRFRAHMMPRWPGDRDVHSQWSGWFSIADEPIMLTWAAFDFEDGDDV